jgi:N-acyl-D-aspartate/D-glutamate deacylase
VEGLTVTPLENRVIAMAKRTNGVRTDEVTGANASSVHNVMRRRTAAGLMFKATVSFRNVRFFHYESMRDAFMESVKIKQFHEKQARALPSLERAPWAADTPAVITDKTVFTQCPNFVPRFQERVPSFVHGVLARG